MMWISVIFLGIYGTLFLISRKTQLEGQHPKWKVPFCKAAVFLWELWGEKNHGRKNKTKQELQSLWTTRHVSWKDYEVKKVTIVLTILFLALALSCVFSIFFQKEAEILSFLKRPSYGKPAKTEELDVSVEGEEKAYKIPIQIQARRYSQQEAKDKIENALLKLDEIVLGENDSFDEVRSDLILPKTMEDGMISIQWTLTPYGVISDTGKILRQTQEDGELIRLEALVQCQEEKGSYMAFAKIFPRNMTQEEEMIQKIGRAVQKQEEENSQETQMNLPKQVDGKVLIWRKTKISIASLICILGVLFAVLFWINEDQKIEKIAKKRQNQLKVDYVAVVFKMRMLLGAGMTIRSAFFRIAEEYEEREKKEIRYVYEEMICSCREMESGVSEERAYENFGQRCGQSRYLKLARILGQHLKKGTEGLEEILSQEMQQTQEERMAFARQMGEEAGTKLLIPMGMMLMVVLVILILPAFLNF